MLLDLVDPDPREEQRRSGTSYRARSTLPLTPLNWTTSLGAGTCTKVSVEMRGPRSSCNARTKDEIKPTREGKLKELSAHPVTSDKLPTSIYEAPGQEYEEGFLACLRPPGGKGL